MQKTEMPTENHLVLRKAAKDAQMAYFDHLAGGGKRDPDRERWIEALTDGADAITRASVLASSLAQVERERDALMYDYPIGIECHTCKHETTDCYAFPCNDCVEASRNAHHLMWEWRGVCGENTKEKETLQEEENR